MIVVPGQSGGGVSGAQTSPGSNPDPPDPEASGLPRVIITIDGPAGTGKSSVARLLAKRLGLDFLDTGAMYRAAAVVAIDQNLGHDASDEIIDAVAREDLHFDWSKDPPEMLCSGKSVAGRLREPAVTALVSHVAAISGLRAHMVRKQRLVANQHPRLVTEGRDQGSVVFPDADVKFYLEATPEVRAHRRAGQLREVDPSRTIDEKAILANIVERDAADSSRADGPLICPGDAERLDTSMMTFEAVVAHLEDAVRTALAPKTLTTLRRCADPAR